MGNSMEAEQIDHVSRGRALVQGAFSEHSGPVGSPMSVWSGKGSGQRESKLKASRGAIGFSATRVHATESRNTKFSKAPKASGLGGSRVRNVIDCLPKLQFLWVCQCYNPNPEVKREAGGVLFNELWREYEAAHLKHKFGSTREIAHLMVRIQLSRCTSYRGFVLWDAERPLEIRQLKVGESTGINQQAWHRSFEPHWRAIRQEIITLDRRAMESVSAKC